MDMFAPRHLLLILLIVLLVFGTKKLRTIGSDLGGAVRGFKESMKTGESETHSTGSSDAVVDAQLAQDGRSIFTKTSPTG